MHSWRAILGRKYESQVPCYEMVRDYYAEVLGVRLPDYLSDRPGHLELAEMVSLISEHGDGWERVEEPDTGDVVRLWTRKAGEPSHVGIYMDGARMLHAPAGKQGAHVVSLADDMWARRVIDYRRYHPETWRLEAFPDPLSSQRVSIDMPYGTTVFDGLRLSGMRVDREGHVRLLIGGDRIDLAWAKRIRPRPGTLVSARSVPGVTVLAAIAAAVAAAVPGAGVLGAALGGAAFAAVGATGAVTAVAFASVGIIVAGVGIIAGLGALISLTAPSSPSGGSATAVGPGNSPATNGVGNEIRQFGPVPVLLGKLRVFPPMYALPFTTINGADRFWNIGLAVSGYRCKIDHTDELGRSGIEVGGVPIEDIPNADWEITQGGAIPPDVELDIEVKSVVTTSGTQPVGYWLLDDAGAPLANEIGGGVDLLVSGSPAFGQQPVLVGSSRSSIFTQATSAIYTDAAPITDWSADWTMMVNMRLVTLESSSYTLLMIGETGESLAIARSSSLTRFVYDHPIHGTQRLTGSMFSTSGNTVFLVQQGGTCTLWSNGAQIASLPLPDLTTQKLTYGAGRNGAAFVGHRPSVWQDISVWNRSLSRDEMRTLTNIATQRLEGIPVRRGPPIRLLGDTVTEVQVNSNQQHPAATDGNYVVKEWVTRQINGRAEELGVDIVFLGGLWRIEIISKKGENRPASVGIQIQYRLSGTEEWADAASAAMLGRLEDPSTLKPVNWEVMSGASGTTPGTSTPDGLPAIRVWGESQSTLLQGFRWPVVAGRDYEVRLRQFTTEPATNRAGQSDVPAFAGDFQILSYKAISRNRSPLRGRSADTWALVNVRLPINEVGNTVGQVSVLAESIFRERESSAWTDERPTRNGASLALACLQNRALNADPLGDALLDLPRWDAFASRATTTDLYVDFVSNALDLANTVLIPSFASLGSREKIGVAEDRPGMDPVQDLTSRDMAGFSWTKRLLDLPDAVRVQFVDAAREYQQGEVIVYRDGFDESTAMTFGTDAIAGVTDRVQAHEWETKKLRMASLRDVEFSGTVWLSHLNAMRGDVVRFSHQLALIGLRPARIVAVTLNLAATHAVSVTVDEQIPYATGVLYGVRYRRVVSGSILSTAVSIENPDDLSNVVEFSTPIAVASAPAVDDQVTVGERGEETLECLVREMRHRNIDGIPAADVVLIPYAPAAHNAVDDLPEFDPIVALPGGTPHLRAPDVPTILHIVSDESVMVATPHGLHPRLVVYVVPRGGFGGGVVFFQARARRVVDIATAGRRVGPYVISDQVDGSPAKLTIDQVVEGAEYEVQVRAISAVGAASAWSSPMRHLVTGGLTPPPDVQDLRREGEMLRWSLPAVPVDLDGYEIRTALGTSLPVPWNAAIPAHAGVWKVAEFPVSQLRNAASLTVLVRAVDRGGRLSENAARLTVQLPPRGLNVLSVTDHRALGWPGTIIGGAESGGDLVATATAGDDTQDAWLPDDSQPAWLPDDSSLAWGAGSEALSYTVRFTPSTTTVNRLVVFATQWTPLSAVANTEYRELGPVPAWEADDSMSAWDVSDSALAWGEEEWSPWRPWPVTLSFALVKPYELRMSMPAQRTPNAITQMFVSIDVDDRRDVVGNPPISAAGSRLPLSSSFNAIRLVLPTREQSPGDTSVRIEVLDKQPFGPLVMALDADGDPVASSAWDFEVIGY